MTQAEQVGQETVFSKFFKKARAAKDFAEYWKDKNILKKMLIYGDS